MSATEEKFGPKLNLTIVHCSSEDANFPISELQRHTAGTHGWQSAQQCEYPVELGFRFDGETTLDYLRILSHESKITSKLEVFICEATDEDRATQTFPPYDKAVFRRLGHIKFSTNEDKDFEARELKTVNVHRDVLYLKLLLRQCHPNGVNIFNQVGIVALSVHGRLLVPFPRPVGANAVDHSLELIMNAQDAADEVPLDQMTPQKVLTIRGTAVDSDTGAGDDGAHDVNSIKTGSETDELDPTTAKKIKELTIHKARAVSEEDYDLAKALKEMIATLKHNGRQIAQLEVRKRHAVEEEDYDTAKQLKMQIDALRAEAMRKPAANASRAPLVPQPPFARHESGGGGLRGAHQGAFGNDDIPVGGGGGAFGGGPVGHDAPASFDERPAVARAQPQPSEYPDESAAAQPPAPRPAPFGRAAPAHGPTSHDDRPAVAQTPASLDEILKQGDSGGIVVTSKPAAAPLKTAAFDGPSMAPWERALNAVVVKLSGDQPPADALAAPKLTEYKEFIGAFGTYVTSCFFCKRWQLREAAITAIVSQEGFDALVGVKGSSAVAVGVSLLSYLGSKGHGVQDTISQVFFATCDALKKLICQETRPVAPIAQLANPLFALLPDLMLKAGDSNQRIREQATSILMLLAMSTLGAERVSAAALAEPETQGKRPLNHRVHVARTSLVGVLLDKVGLNRKDARTGLTVDAIMTRLCLPCLQHSHQDVREGAMDVIVQLHHIAGAASVAPFLNDVKPAQRALIDEQLAKGGAAAAVGSGGVPPGAAAAAAHGGGAAAGRGSGAAGGRNADQEMASSSISVEGNQKSAVLAAAREAKRQQQGGAAAIPAAPAGAAGGKKSAAAAPGKQAAPSPKKKDPADEARTCQFCGKFDKRFNEATLDVHYVRTCPMLCPCPLCGQVTEIASLQEHLVNECDRKSLVRKCPMCHEAVRAEDLDAHVAAKACIPAKPAEYSICPLCHAKLQPGERGWMQHLLQAPGCRNNPRRWDGGNGEEFN